MDGPSGSMSAHEALAHAERCRIEGRLMEAAAVCRQVLQAQPDLAEAEHFYRSFGMDVQAESAKLVLRTAGKNHVQAANQLLVVPNTSAAIPMQSRSISSTKR